MPINVQRKKLSHFFELEKKKTVWFLGWVYDFMCERKLERECAREREREREDVCVYVCVWERESAQCSAFTHMTRFAGLALDRASVNPVF